MDVVMGGLVLWKVFTESTQWWSCMTKPITARFRPSIVRNTRFVLHLVMLCAMLVCLAFDFLFFYYLYNSPLIDTTWSFGQIVGLTIWSGTILELAYLEYCKLLHLDHDWTILDKDRWNAGWLGMAVLQTAKDHQGG